MSFKLPISAIIASHNEGPLLADCLSSLFFCEEIIVVNLESTDNTIEIAKKYTAKIINHERVPIVEIIRNKFYKCTNYNWVLFIDPDERIDKALALDIKKSFGNLNKNVSTISVPWRFYFKNKPLKGTFWGSDCRKVILINNEMVGISSIVHKGYINKNPDFVNLNIELHSDNVLHHLWMQSYSQLYMKHKRYIEREGIAEYNNGVRYSILSHLKLVLTSFYDSYIIFKGWKDGFTGIFLSMFYSWYRAKAFSALKHFVSTESNQV